MSEQRLMATAPAAPGLALAVRDGNTIAPDETGALLRLLRAVAAEAPNGANASAELRSRVAPLLPVAAPPAEPEWLRAEEMLDEAAACPSERLFANSLNTSALWWRLDDLRAALLVIRDTVAAGVALPAGLDAEQVIRACSAVEAALARIDADAWVQVRDADAPQQ